MASISSPARGTSNGNTGIETTPSLNDILDASPGAQSIASEGINIGEDKGAGETDFANSDDEFDSHVRAARLALFNSDDENELLGRTGPSAPPSRGAASSLGPLSPTQADNDDDVPPPPPPYGSGGSSGSGAAPPPERPEDFDDSAYMKDGEGNIFLKWKVEYATRGGGGRAQCRDMQCMEAENSVENNRAIEKGELRIGRRVYMEKDNSVLILWHHARCMFNVFLRARSQTRTIEKPSDIEGWDTISTEDQELLLNIIAGNQDLKDAKFRAAQGFGTGSKRAAPGEKGPAAEKKQKLNLAPNNIKPKVGDRVWTFCRVRPPPTPGNAGAGPVDLPMRSKKPELGQIKQLEKENCFVIQFEKKEHEQERAEMYALKKFKNIRGWLRYPRLFEGKAQAIPVNWVQWKRAPPRLCGCTRQEWHHECDGGISCTRGSRMKVWGVGQ